MTDELMTCPVCGQKFPVDKSEILDNGNPACPDCVRKEREKADGHKD